MSFGGFVSHRLSIRFWTFSYTRGGGGGGDDDDDGDDRRRRRPIISFPLFSKSYLRKT